MRKVPILQLFIVTVVDKQHKGKITGSRVAVTMKNIRLNKTDRIAFGARGLGEAGYPRISERAPKHQMENHEHSSMIPFNPEVLSPSQTSPHRRLQSSLQTFQKLCCA